MVASASLKGKLNETKSLNYHLCLCHSLIHSVCPSSLIVVSSVALVLFSAPTFNGRCGFTIKETMDLGESQWCIYEVGEIVYFCQDRMDDIDDDTSLSFNLSSLLHCMGRQSPGFLRQGQGATRRSIREGAERMVVDGGLDLGESIN